ncbi:arsenic transporter, partial [Burkholderia cenocepacia]|nr:arsenic transporter [Burkholderia cenocepacia]
SPFAFLGEISWSVLPLVAGLFVLVEMLAHTGVIDALSRLLASAAGHDQSLAAAVAGGALALGSNAINNLPAGLIASATVAAAHSPQRVVDALLIA